jgi:hypothetical protein
MPGGFHPFHAGHAALYQSAVEAFPGAQVFVAATNDTSNRPFPFAIKEKLSKLAGVAPGHFVQVKSPFRAEEITSKFDPDRDRLIFVRSEKDANKPPQAGGNKKDGSPAYLQPLAGQTNIRPFAEHAYMAYLPTVEFGPGMTSATEIRTVWPTLSAKHKVALVMSLYPTTQRNRKLAANVVKMLDTAMGNEQDVAEGDKKPSIPNFTQQGTGYKSVNYASNVKNDINLSKTTPPPQPIPVSGSLVKNKLNNTLPNDAKLIQILKRGLDAYYEYIEDGIITDLDLETIKELLIQSLDNDGLVDPDQFAYDASREIDFLSRMGETDDWEAAFYEVAQRVNAHIKNNKKHNVAEMDGQNFVGGMTASYQQRENQPIDEDYIDEKWSQKYKSSINCANPKGFSQQAHCAGRKK